MTWKWFLACSPIIIMSLKKHNKRTRMLANGTESCQKHHLTKWLTRQRRLHHSHHVSARFSRLEYGSLRFGSVWIVRIVCALNFHWFQNYLHFVSMLFYFAFSSSLCRIRRCNQSNIVSGRIESLMIAFMKVELELRLECTLTLCRTHIQLANRAECDDRCRQLYARIQMQLKWVIYYSLCFIT